MIIFLFVSGFLFFQSFSNITVGGAKDVHPPAAHNEATICRPEIGLFSYFFGIFFSDTSGL